MYFESQCIFSLLKIEHLRTGNGKEVGGTLQQTNDERPSMKTYWRDKADHLKSKPREFYKKFQPFINKKIKDLQNDINIKISGKIEREQPKVADEFATYFATMVNSIGGDNVASLGEESFHEHTSVNKIRESSCSARLFSFRKLQLHDIGTIREL